MTRADFLSEVQYLGNVPAGFDFLEEGLASRIAAGFERHPWVERVARVELRAPQRVIVRMEFRRPVLRVSSSAETRAVDRTGVLLPQNADLSTLPNYSGLARPPAGPAGTLWGDAGVEAAAKRAARVARQ
jgi:hypothetical protein